MSRKSIDKEKSLNEISQSQRSAPRIGGEGSPGPSADAEGGNTRRPSGDKTSQKTPPGTSNKSSKKTKDLKGKKSPKGGSSTKTDEGNKRASLTEDGNKRASLVEDGNKRTSLVEDGNKRASLVEDGNKRASLVEDSGNKRASLTEDGNKRASLTEDGNKRASLVEDGNKRTSLKEDGNKRASLKEDGNKRASLTEEANKRSSLSKEGEKPGPSLPEKTVEPGPPETGPSTVRSSILKHPGETLLNHSGENQHIAIDPDAMEHHSGILKRRSQESAEGAALKLTQDKSHQKLGKGHKKRKGSKNAKELNQTGLSAVQEEVTPTKNAEEEITGKLVEPEAAGVAGEQIAGQEQIEVSEEPAADLPAKGTSTHLFAVEEDNLTLAKSAERIPSFQKFPGSQEAITNPVKVPSALQTTNPGEFASGNLRSPSKEIRRVPSAQKILSAQNIPESGLAKQPSAILKKEPSATTIPAENLKSSPSSVKSKPLEDQEPRERKMSDKVDKPVTGDYGEPEMFDMSTCPTFDSSGAHCCDVQDIAKALQLSLPPHCKVTETIILDNTPTIDLEQEVDRLVAVAKHHCNREKNAIRARYEEELKSMKTQHEDEMRRMKNKWEDEAGRLKGKFDDDFNALQAKLAEEMNAKQKFADYEEEIDRLRRALEENPSKDVMQSLEATIREMEKALEEFEGLKAENKELKMELERLMKILDEHGLLKDQVMEHEGEIARLQELVKSMALEHESQLDMAQNEILGQCEGDKKGLLERIKAMEGLEEENRMLKEEIQRLRELLAQVQADAAEMEAALREQIEILVEELDTRPKVDYRHDGSIMVEQQEPLLPDLPKLSLRPVASANSILLPTTPVPVQRVPSVVREPEPKPEPIQPEPQPLELEPPKQSIQVERVLSDYQLRFPKDSIPEKVEPFQPVVPDRRSENPQNKLLRQRFSQAPPEILDSSTQLSQRRSYYPTEEQVPGERPKRQSYYTRDQFAQMAPPTASRCSLQKCCSRQAVHLTNSIFTVTPMQQTAFSGDRGIVDDRIIYLEQKVGHLVSLVDRMQTNRPEFGYQTQPMQSDQQYLQQQMVMPSAFAQQGGGYPGASMGMQGPAQYGNTGPLITPTCPQNPTAVAERLGGLESTLEAFNKKYKPRLPPGANAQQEESQYNNLLGEIVREIKHLKECMGSSGNAPLASSDPQNYQQNDFRMQTVYKSEGNGKPNQR